jgi:hypothetical protein
MSQSPSTDFITSDTRWVSLIGAGAQVTRVTRDRHIVDVGSPQNTRRVAVQVMAEAARVLVPSVEAERR